MEDVALICCVLKYWLNQLTWQRTTNVDKLFLYVIMTFFLVYIIKTASIEKAPRYG